MNKLFSILLTTALITISCLFCNSCGANQAPIIKQITADSDQVMESEEAVITCEAVDPDNDALTYEWSATSGFIENHSPQATWKAPIQQGDYLVMVTVKDTHGHEVNGQIKISVVANAPPVIDSLVAEPSAVGASQQGYIICTAHDPEGGRLTYSWEVDKGEISGEGDNVTWTAPSGKDTCKVKVTVTDEAGNTVSMNTSITVLANHLPVIKTLTANPSSVVGGKTSSITCEATDADDDNLTYSWETTAGMIAGDGKQITWTSPTDCQQATITVSVGDGRGSKVLKTVTISVHKAGG